jgi:hypothetical protein
MVLLVIFTGWSPVCGASYSVRSPTAFYLWGLGLDRLVGSPVPLMYQETT